MDEIKKFKGGSLSATTLMREKNNTSDLLFVRKKVRTDTNREYGFQRWYSQLKKQQRINALFPKTFPEIFRIGVEGKYAYFDMEYMNGYVNGYEYLLTETKKQNIERFLSTILKKMNRLHAIHIPSSPDLIEIYLQEIIERKLHEIKSFPYKTIIFNNKKIPSFTENSEKYKNHLRTYYSEHSETITHGNITLENILYNPQNNKVIFIDPYEENVIDSKLGDYSQLFQSCNAKYEQYNAEKIQIKGNEIFIDDKKNKGIDYFNKIFNDYLTTSLSKKQYHCVKLFEIAQFIHMLPFKKQIDWNKTIFFYGLASKLFNDFIERI